MHFESGDGGRETVKLSLAKAELWKKDSSGTCPGSLAFQLDLPKTFMFGNEELVGAHDASRVCFIVFLTGVI